MDKKGQVLPHSVIQGSRNVPVDPNTFQQPVPFPQAVAEQERRGKREGRVGEEEREAGAEDSCGFRAINCAHRRKAGSTRKQFSNRTRARAQRGGGLRRESAFIRELSLGVREESHHVWLSPSRTAASVSAQAAPRAAAR